MHVSEFDNLGPLDLTPKTDVVFVMGDWNSKAGSQETLAFALEYRLKQGKG